MYRKYLVPPLKIIVVWLYISNVSGLAFLPEKLLVVDYWESARPLVDGSWLLYISDLRSSSRSKYNYYYISIFGGIPNIVWEAAGFTSKG